MKRVLRWLGIGLGGLLALAVLALVSVYIASSRIIARTYDVPLVALEAPTDSVLLADGQRLTALWGCAGCHGDRLAGELMFEQLFLGRIAAPNLTRILPLYSDAELERLVRHGVKRDGKSAFVMPAEFFYHLPDDQLGSIIAFIRTMPAAEGPEGGVKFGPLGRLLLVLGEFRPAAEEVDRSVPRVPYPEPTDLLGLGEYWATRACTFCHGEDLRGDEEVSAPSLEVVATAYSPTQFEFLMRTGIGVGGRRLGLMSEVARDNLRHMTPQEVAGLYAYLRSRFGGDSGAPDPATADSAAVQ
jgi:cytochrome c553